MAKSRSMDGNFGSDSNCHSPRSILKQFLEVKFKYINLRHFQLLTDIGMKLAENPDATSAYDAICAARPECSISDVTARPGYRIAQSE